MIPNRHRRCLLLAVMLPFIPAATDAQESQTHPTPDRFRTALIYDELFLAHETGAGFPESPDRLRRMTSHLKQHPIFERLLWMEPNEKLDPMPWILMLHTSEYVAEFKRACEAGEKQMRGGDTPISKRSFEVAVGAVGGALTAVDAVMGGRVKNAFAALRPPGHHAMPARAKGFCFFGNAAIAARYAQKRHGLERVMIVDWDVHHGDGTQAFFIEDSSVYVFSTHQYPFYPGTSGAPDVTGKGKGEGYNLNVPLAAGSGDEGVIKAYRTQLAEAFRKFKPQMLIISAGFDAHEDDPLGALKWSSEVYATLTNILLELCREQGHERVISVLEGGYSERGITEGVRRHLEALEAAPKVE